MAVGIETIKNSDLYKLNLVKSFTTHLRRINLSQLTVINYRKDLETFAKFFLQNYSNNFQSWYLSKRCKGLISDKLHASLIDTNVNFPINNMPWKSVSSLALENFLYFRFKSGISASTLNRQLSSIRNFYRFLTTQHETIIDPSLGVKAPKQPKPLPKSISVDITKQLLDAKIGKRWQDVRDNAMFELMYSSGIRVSELSSLDISPGLNNLNDGWLRIVKGKGNKTRMAPVGETAVKSMKDWMTLREKHANAGDLAVFVNNRGSRLSVRGIQLALDKLAQKTGIPFKISPHRLRHACATHVLESSGDLRAVQELLGHEKISTTQIYTKLDFQHLSTVYDKAHPRAVNNKNKVVKH